MQSHVRHLVIALCVILPAADVVAQSRSSAAHPAATTLTETSGVRQQGGASGAATTQKTRPVTVDIALLAGILKKRGLSEDQRDDLLGAVASTMSDGKVAVPEVANALRTSLDSADAAMIAEIILKRLDNGKTSFLSSVAAGGSSDRLTSSVEVVSFSRHGSRGVFEARIVTGVAVSSADSGGTATTADAQASLRQYRTRTAELLSALGDGGPLSVYAGYAFHTKAKANGEGWRTTIGASAASTGKNPDPADQALSLGMVGEVRRTVSAGDITAPTFFTVSLRGGARVAKGGVMSGSDESKLLFGQGSLEFRTPLAATPIGVSYTWVNGPFQPYTRRLQFYGIAGM